MDATLLRPFLVVGSTMEAQAPLAEPSSRRREGILGASGQQTRADLPSGSLRAAAAGTSELYSSRSNPGQRPAACRRRPAPRPSRRRHPVGQPCAKAKTERFTLAEPADIGRFFKVFTSP